MSSYHFPPGGSSPHPQPMAPLPQPTSVSSGAVPAYSVDDAQILEAYRQHQESTNRGGGGPAYFRFLSHDGGKNWNNAPVGFERRVLVWVCQPPPGDRRIYVTIRNHFYKYYEGGSLKNGNIDCLESECLFCQARLQAAGLPQFQQSVENWGGEPRGLSYYQIILLEELGSHVDAKPMILPAGPQLHGEIGEAIRTLGAVTALIDPMQGRPLILSRKKTGPQSMDVEYKASFYPNAMPLPPQAYGILHQIYPWDTIRKRPTAADYQQAIMRLGWPMPGAPIQAQVPQSFNPAPMPPHQNPYPPQMPPAPPPPTAPMAQAPGMVAPTVPGASIVPPETFLGHQTVGPGGGLLAPQLVGPQNPPPMAPPPVTTPQGTSGASIYAPPQGIPQPTPETPSPGIQGPPPPYDLGPPPFESGSVAAPPPTPGTGQILQLDPNTGKLPEGIVLDSEGRERCFGKYSEKDLMCVGCPEWIKSQCVLQTPGAESGAHLDPHLTQLQNQLEGGSP